MSDKINDPVKFVLDNVFGPNSTYQKSLKTKEVKREKPKKQEK
tara:strand:- start:146 stop:274 length:129 start_codon:yes stop_codon:yes gene_type:complete